METQRLRAERMAQYKEERRQQLASQYGPRDDSGSSPATPVRRFISRSTATTPVRNGDDRSGSGSSSNAEQPSPSSIQRVRTTRTSRLRAAVTYATGIYVLTLPSILYWVAVVPDLAFLNSGLPGDVYERRIFGVRRIYIICFRLTCRDVFC